MTSAAASPDAQTHGESLSRSRASGKSRSSFRLYFFTFLSVVACSLALANVASAATPSGEDQYLEQVPNGGGNSGEDNTDVVDTNNDGVITEAEVKAAAEKQKKKAAKKAKDDEGATGVTGAAGGSTTPTPPAAQSVATAAKIGPFSKNTALILAALALAIALGAFVFGGSGAGLFGIGASSGAARPPQS